MRKLMWFSVGFALACAAGAYLVNGVWLLKLSGFSAVAMAGIFFLKSFTAKRAAAVLLGCTVGFLWLYGFDSLYLSEARYYDAKTQALTITATDYSYKTENGLGVDGKLTLDGKTYHVRAYLTQADALKPGDQVEGSFLLRFTGAGADKAATFHPGKGIFLLCYQKGDVNVISAQEVSLEDFAAVLRKDITGMLDRVFPEDTLAFARALLLGDSSLLTYEEDTAFQVSGIRHVIAVSGLHVSILFSLVYMLSGKRRFLTALLGLPALLLFAAVAGFTPSINRACIMQALMILALVFNHEYDMPTALGFASLVMLCINPLTITSVSFQLSVGCMIGIFLFSETISAYLLDKKRFGPAKGKSLKARLTRWSVRSVSVTLSAMTTTIPLCAVYFGAVSLVGILTNLLALWVISAIFYGIILACLLSAIYLPLGQVAAWCISWPIRYVLVIAKTLSDIPFAAIYTCSVYVVAWLIFAYILFAVFIFCKEKRPVIFALCLTVSLIISLTFSYAEPRLDNFRMSVLDVGNGQAIILQYRNQTYLVDCGGDTPETAADAVAEKLLSQGITKLDGVILSHYDKDHAAGLPLLLTRISSDRLYLPNMHDAGNIRAELSNEYSHKISWIEPESIVSIDSMKITVYAPKQSNSENESSLCILFQPENCDILITADRTTEGELALLKQAKLPKLEVLVVGHHGSKSSTGIPLLATTQPERAVISVGRDNSYGHPAQNVLNRLLAYGCKIYRTDLDGTILFRG